MRLTCWSLVAVAGLTIMGWAYWAYMRPDAAGVWSSAVIFLGDGAHDAPRLPAGFHGVPLTARELPPGPMAEALINALGAQSADQRRSLSAQLCEKLLLLEPGQAGIDAGALESGRMPRPGQGELLAGYQASAHDRLAVAGHDFTVVGVLRRGLAPLADCYVLPPHASLAKLFDRRDTANYPGVLLQPTVAETGDAKFREKLKTLFPSKQFTAVVPMVRVARRPYYLYLVGEGLLLWGGSLALIAFYHALAGRIGWRLLRDPLMELAARPKLLGTLHLVYFGLFMAAALAVYEAPKLQISLVSVVRHTLSDPRSPLGEVAKAYQSLNIPRAAAMTFVVNFFLGSGAVITLPSLIVPGSGILTAVFRATIWGVILAPSFVLFSLGMLAHSGTLLLEGEGYILAAFFGLLVPLYLCDRAKGAGLWRRYGLALLMNLKAMILVAIVLGVAACYEAVEVILMNR
jgi:hypothetical protein